MCTHDHLVVLAEIYAHKSSLLTSSLLLYGEYCQACWPHPSFLETTGFGFNLLGAEHPLSGQNLL